MCSSRVQSQGVDYGFVVGQGCRLKGWAVLTHCAEHVTGLHYHVCSTGWLFSPTSRKVTLE